MAKTDAFPVSQSVSALLSPAHVAPILGINQCFNLPMHFGLAANGALLLHLAFIVFALFGGALTLRWRWMPLAHLPAAAWALFVELTGRICPLTTIENDFRISASQSGYAESFVEHYLLGLIYPSGLTREVQFVLAATVVVINIAIYSWLALRRPAHH